MPKRLPFEVLIAASLMLGSCNSAKSSAEDQMTDIATDAAADAIASSDKLTDLESRLSDAESKLGDAEGRIEELETQISTDRVNFANLFNRATAIENALNM
jgi:predicted  nucleic acid-binding Zn-ribbon protein